MTAQEEGYHGFFCFLPRFGISSATPTGSFWQQHAVLRKAEKGTILHNGSVNCTGLLLVGAGQLRAYILSDEGREITLYRLFDRDLCLFSASCMLNSIQFEITVEAEKDTLFWLIPAELYQALMEKSGAVSRYTNEVMAGQVFLM